MHSPHSHSTRHFAAERAPSEAAQWARLEGKSEAMAADLVESATAPKRERLMTNTGVCPRCLASATLGAAIAIFLDRLIAGR